MAESTRPALFATAIGAALVAGWLLYPLSADLLAASQPASAEAIMSLGVAPLLLWLVVDRLEKLRYRAGRDTAGGYAERIVHRPGRLSQALFPLVWSGFAAAAVFILMRPTGSTLATLGIAAAAGLVTPLVVIRFGGLERTLELDREGLALGGGSRIVIPWHAISAARMVTRRSGRTRRRYLAVALKRPERYGLRPVSFLGRLFLSGEARGDVVLTPLDRFLEEPRRIVDDVRGFILQARIEERSEIAAE